MYAHSDTDGTWTHDPVHYSGSCQHVMHCATEADRASPGGSSYLKKTLCSMFSLRKTITCIPVAILGTKKIWLQILISGSYPEGQDIAHVLVDGTTTTKAWPVTELGLIPGVQYYTSVKAINMAGLETVSRGDGFVVSCFHSLQLKVYRCNSLAPNDSETTVHLFKLL